MITEIPGESSPSNIIAAISLAMQSSVGWWRTWCMVSFFGSSISNGDLIQRWENDQETAGKARCNYRVRNALEGVIRQESGGSLLGDCNRAKR